MNLIAAAIIGIAVIVLLIAACKVHPFLSLLAGSFVMAVCAGVPLVAYGYIEYLLGARQVRTLYGLVARRLKRG